MEQKIKTTTNTNETKNENKTKNLKLIKLLIMVGILGTILGSGCVEEKQNNICKTNSDCVVAIHINSCCVCPFVYSKKQVDSNPALMEYEPGKDYFPFMISELECGGVLCELCKPAAGAVCHNGNCVDADFVKRTYPNTSNFDFYPIHEINQNKFSSGTYNTEGFVVKIYTCPPCPKDAVCKMCMENNIVISENNKILETYSLTEKELIIFVENPKQFELSKKYTFSINITNDKTTSTDINDIKLLEYDEIKPRI